MIKKKEKNKEYYDNGQLKEIYNYKDDKKEGEYKLYHKNGNLKKRI